MRDYELTLEAKAAIRSYLLKLLTVPAIVIALVPFLTTYFVKDVAQSKADMDARGKIQARIDAINADLQ